MIALVFKKWWVRLSLKVKIGVVVDQVLIYMVVEAFNLFGRSNRMQVHVVRQRSHQLVGFFVVSQLGVNLIKIILQTRKPLALLLLILSLIFFVRNDGGKSPGQIFFTQICWRHTFTRHQKGTHIDFWWVIFMKFWWLVESGLEAEGALCVGVICRFIHKVGVLGCKRGERPFLKIGGKWLSFGWWCYFFIASQLYPKLVCRLKTYFFLGSNTTFLWLCQLRGVLQLLFLWHLNILLIGAHFALQDHWFVFHINFLCRLFYWFWFW